MKKTTSFKIKPIGKGEYKGFILDKDSLYRSKSGAIFHNSGKSVVENGIIGHCSKFPDKYELIILDPKQVTFNLARGVTCVKGIALDLQSCANAMEAARSIMNKRYSFLKENFVEHIKDLPKDLEVDYYDCMGRSYQFDSICSVKLDLDKTSREYNKLLKIYEDGRYDEIMTYEMLYEKLKDPEFIARHPQLPEVKGYNSYVDENSIRKTRGTFVRKVVLVLIDELNELMSSDDYKVTDSVRSCMSAIARLARAADVRLLIAGQYASPAAINTELKNNIYLKVALGNFSDTTSNLIFDKDLSHLAQPEIKGRALMMNFNTLYRLQTYYNKQSEWEFDESMKDTHINPQYIKNMAEKGIEIDDSGFVKQYRQGEKPKTTLKLNL
jgi:DNA segregation ATPase FtsK/SpoIIIE-like protein